MKNRLRPYMTRRILSYIAAGVIIIVFYLLLTNWSGVWGVVSRFLSIIAPFTTGVMLAYLLNLLMRPIEKFVFGWIKNRKKLRRLLAVFLTIILFIAIVGALLYLLLPQLIESITVLVTSLQHYLEQTDSVIDDIVGFTGIPKELLESVFGTWAEILDGVITWATDVAAPALLGFSIRFGSGLVNFVIALFTSIYILIDKERLTRQAKLVVRAFSSEERYNRVIYVARRSNSIFSRYFGGMIVDSMIVGLVCFVGMTIFGFPYAAMISALVGVTNLIPTFGPFIGAIPSALIILMSGKPIMALWFLVFIIVLQQLDANLLMPHIVGDVTGLSALWVLFGLWVSGALFGFTGLVFGVPVFAALYFFAGERVKKVLLQKGYDTDGNEIAEPAEPQPRAATHAAAKTQPPKGKVANASKKSDKPKK